MFDLDWTDLETVKTLARSLGSGQTVYKHPERANYNITHSSRKDLFKPEWVVFQT